MKASDNLLTCDSCGVVVDFNNYVLERFPKFYNHDQDKVCEAVVCPVCKEYIPNEEWEGVTP